MNIKKLLESYQLLKLMNSRLKYEMFRSKKNNNLNNYSRYKALQEDVQRLLDNFETQDIDISKELNRILQSQSEMYLVFRSFDIKKNKREKELTEELKQEPNQKDYERIKKECEEIEDALFD